MVIGIDISQIVYEGTGVSNFVKEIVRNIIRESNHEYILFATTFSSKQRIKAYYNSLGDAHGRVRLKLFPLPIQIIEFVWNRLHVFPIELFIGKIDIFWSSDWVQPKLLSAKGVTTIHDLTPFRYPETFSQDLVAVHTRKLERSKQVCSVFFCDSEATKKDAHELLHIPLEKLFVVYAGRNQ